MPGCAATCLVAVAGQRSAERARPSQLRATGSGERAQERAQEPPSAAVVDWGAGSLVVVSVAAAVVAASVAVWSTSVAVAVAVSVAVVVGSLDGGGAA